MGVCFPAFFGHRQVSLNGFLPTIHGFGSPGVRAWRRGIFQQRAVERGVVGENNVAARRKFCASCGCSFGPPRSSDSV